MTPAKGQVPSFQVVDFAGYLQANLPLLQRELLHCAQLAKQTPQQYLAHNEHILFDPARSPVEPQDLANELNENGKRKSPDRCAGQNCMLKDLKKHRKFFGGGGRNVAG